MPKSQVRDLNYVKKHKSSADGRQILRVDLKHFKAKRSMSKAEYLRERTRREKSHVKES